MPFYDRLYNEIPDDQLQPAPYGIKDDDAEGETPSFGETLNANFRLNNTIVSAIQSNRFGTPDAAADYDPNFNPWDSIKGTPDEADWNRYVDARNATDMENIRLDIQAEKRARDVIERSGLAANLLTGGLAGIADPLIL